MRLCLFFVAMTASFAQAPASKTVEVYGQKIHYLEAGSGPTVILLHGLGGDAKNWAQTIPVLSKQFHVYAPDQIGFGESDKPMLNYRVSTLVDFLDAFYRKLGITTASLVGNSLGGWTAASFTIAHPDKVERLVLVDAAGYSPERTHSAKLSRDVMIGLNPSSLAGTKQMLAVVFYNKMMLSDMVAEQAFADHIRKNDGYTINQFIDSILRDEDYVDGKLGAIKVPTLIVWGKQDALVPLKAGEAYAKDIAGSQTLVIDKCGHIPMVECAAAFHAGLIPFLGGTTAATAATAAQ